MSINEVQQEIIEEFSIYDDWLDRYQYIVDLGNSLSDFPPEEETDMNLIEGCQSKVWIIAVGLFAGALQGGGEVGVAAAGEVLGGAQEGDVVDRDDQRQAPARDRPGG